MTKPLKTLDETLAEEMRNSEFRDGYLQAKTELEEFVKIRELRAQIGLSQASTAMRMGTSQSAVARLERGLSNGHWPSVDTLRRYVTALGKKLEIRVV